ncbi:MAG: formate dehydrogenase accessory sulfurtransferase FdhD [Candidatus Cloacimonetes bacterium]|nr:formate dehydrogenase accessory sulfurtransferase FdhD [Candidatus Cloacimonadota bacterium]
MDDLRLLKEIKRYKNGIFEMLTDVVIREISFTIYINGQRLTAMACLPENLTALALGFLLSEGLVLHMKEIISSTFSQEDYSINFELQIPSARLSNFFQTGEKTSGCGSSLTSALTGSREAFPPFKIDLDSVLQLMQQFQHNSVLFQQTGGVHSAGLVHNEEIVFFADDIGRHNAVDKVAGMALQKEKNLNEHYLLCSGRISSEIVKKCVRLGIPLIVSQSAATSEAIHLGWKYKVYIIGFTRGKRFNIYTGFEEEIFSLT